MNALLLLYYFQLQTCFKNSHTNREGYLHRIVPTNGLESSNGSHICISNSILDMRDGKYPLVGSAYLLSNERHYRCFIAYSTIEGGYGNNPDTLSCKISRKCFQLSAGIRRSWALRYSDDQEVVNHSGGCLYPNGRSSSLKV